MTLLPAGTALARDARDPARDALAQATCTGRTGPYQRQVERLLKLKADGRQSAADCRAVRAYQLKHGIKPAIGFAGPVTWTHLQLRAARRNPNAAGKCPVRAYRVACVDLGRQLTWVQKGRKLALGPVPVRTGRAGYRTRAGWHTVYWRHRNHVSTLYGQPMPYSQFFSGGQAFHAVDGTLFTTVGSRGCVNLRPGDARKLWGVLRKGDRVYVWGRRPGT
ncbi:L,D-transpeptidase family protein [Streptomyces sp. NPDC093094]|uniref:L,D-transpeptidase family protein n=1 Tax=Streptomyces sp. NPDC093094 TaxID=3366026 RepID=UPI0038006660